MDCIKANWGMILHDIKIPVEVEGIRVTTETWADYSRNARKTVQGKIKLIGKSYQN